MCRVCMYMCYYHVHAHVTSEHMYIGIYTSDVCVHVVCCVHGQLQRKTSAHIRDMCTLP